MLAKNPGRHLPGFFFCVENVLPSIARLLRKTIACGLLLVPLSAFSTPFSAENAYLEVGRLKPTTEFGGSYRSYQSDGSGDVKFDDPTDSRSEAAVASFAMGVRVAGSVWLGADYLSIEGDSDGVIGKRVRLGPFRFYVTAPGTEHYQFDIARFWLGYRFVDQVDESLLLTLGLTAIAAKASAVVDGLGQESAHGILPLPTLGMVWRQMMPWNTVLSLAADYSRAQANDLFGQASNLSIALEVPLKFGFSIGLGYRQYDLLVRARRPTYDAELQQTISGPFLLLQQRF